MTKKEIWRFILQTMASVFTALATFIGAQSVGL